MKLKYYLRGLSIGILFTTVILSISFRTHSKTELTDEQIIKKAEELGMIKKDEDTLNLDQLLNSLVTPTVTPSLDPESTQTGDINTDLEETEVNSSEEATIPTVEPTLAEEPTPTITPTLTLTPTMEPTVEPTSTSKLEDNNENEYITVEILPGMTSYEVSRLLRNSSLIDDVWKFNKYMVENDYALRIDIGTYKIKKGSTHKEIAELIVN